MKCVNVVWSILTVGVLMTIAGPAAAQQTYPGKPIRLIVPFAPGGGTNIVARLIGQTLSENLGQQVNVDNRPGGNTVIGSEALVKSPPDGYTIIMVTVAHAINPHLFPTPYDAIRDFAPVASVVGSELLLVVHPSLPANDLRGFIALAKSKPGQLNYATSGSGTSSHLAAEYFNILAAVKIQHIPYKGSGPALTDLIGGQVQLSFQSPSAVVAHIKSGKLNPIAITGQARAPALPQVPTFTEAGLPGLDVKLWYGVLAPAGTPKPIIDRLSTELAAILAVPEFKEKLASQGVEPFFSTPEQFAALIRTDYAKYGKIIKTANIKLED